MRGSEIRPLALSRVDTTLDLSSVGEGDLTRLSETGLREIAERDAGTFPAPSKAKEPALGTRGPDAQHETRNRGVDDVEFLTRRRECRKLRSRQSC